jgi:hypothetical protein
MTDFKALLQALDQSGVVKDLEALAEPEALREETGSTS